MISKWNRQRCLLWTAILFYAAAGFHFSLRLREPVCQGKRISVWIEEMRGVHLDPASVAAIQAVGADAVPYLIKTIERDIEYARRARIQPKLFSPFKVIRDVFLGALPDPLPRKENWNALSALQWLGPDAEAAVPFLIELLQYESKPATNDLPRLGPKHARMLRVQAAQALFGIGPQASSAVPSLIQALNDPDAFVRRSAAGALSNMGKAAHIAAPTLMEALKDSDIHVPGHAARTLAIIGHISPGAKIDLLPMLSDTNAHFRSAAAVALWRLEPDAAETVQRVLENLERSQDAHTRCSTIVLLGKVGAEARVFSGVISDNAQDEDIRVRHLARNAMKEIERESRQP